MSTTETRVFLATYYRPKGRFTVVHPLSTAVSPYIPNLKRLGFTGFFYNAART